MKMAYQISNDFFLSRSPDKYGINNDSISSLSVKNNAANVRKILPSVIKVMDKEDEHVRVIERAKGRDGVNII